MIARSPGRQYGRGVSSYRFPPDLLGDDEDLVLELRPHPIALVWPVAQAVVILAAALLAFLFTPYRWGAWVFALIGGAGIVMLLAWPGKSIAGLTTCRYWVTTDRVIRREGFLVRTTAEIPVAKVTNVRSLQGPIGRMFGFGDVVIETSGFPATIRFEHVRRPEWVRRIVFERMEANRMKARPAGVAYTPASVADELAKLVRLRTDGVITEEEFRSLKSRLVDHV